MKLKDKYWWLKMMKDMNDKYENEDNKGWMK